MMLVGHLNDAEVFACALDLDRGRNLHGEQPIQRALEALDASVSPLMFSRSVLQNNSHRSKSDVRTNHFRDARPGPPPASPPPPTRGGPNRDEIEYTLPCDHLACMPHDEDIGANEAGDCRASMSLKKIARAGTRRQRSHVDDINPTRIP